MSMNALQHQPGPDGPIPACPDESADDPAAAVIAIAVTDKLVCIDLCTGNGMGAGDAEPAHRPLRVDLPNTWRPPDKAVAAFRTARIAYRAGAV